MNQLMKVFFVIFLLSLGSVFVQGSEMSYHSVNVIEGEYQEREIDLSNSSFQVIRTFSKQKGWEFNFSGIFTPAKEKVAGCLYDSQGYLVGTEDGLTVSHRSFPWRSVTFRDQTGKEAVYYYYWEGDQPLISQVKSPVQPDVRYDYFIRSGSKPLISSRKESEGRYLLNEYDEASGKVVRQLAPIGGDAVPRVKNYFDYAEGVTIVYDAMGGKTSYHYDQDKRIIETRQYDGDAIAKIERLFWDRTGNLVSKVHENSASETVKVETFEYDAANRLFKIKMYGAITGKEKVKLAVDSRGKPRDPACESFTTCFEYNSEGKVIARTHNDGPSAQFEYDKDGKLVRHESRGRPEGINSGDDTVRHVEYDTHGNIISAELTEVDGTIKRAQSLYDFANRKVKEEFISSEDPCKILSYKYDLNGNKTESVDNCGNVTKYQYDSLNRLVEVLYPPVMSLTGQGEGGAVQFTETLKYDCLGNVVEYKDLNSDKKTITYNIFGKPLTISYADGSKEVFTYFLNGELESETTRNGFQRLYRRDESGNIAEAWIVDRTGHSELISSRAGYENRTLKEQDSTEEAVQEPYLPKIHTEEAIVQNSLGQSVRQFTILSEGNSIVYLFDAMGRYDTKSTYDPYGKLWSKETFRHDGNGNCVRWTKEQENEVTVLSRMFGPCNRLEKTVEGMGSLQEATTHYVYNEFGEMISVIKPDGISLNQELSEKGTLRRIYSSDGLTNYEFHYDNEGFLTEVYDIVEGRQVNEIEINGQKRNVDVLTLVDPATRDNNSYMYSFMQKEPSDGHKSSGFFSVNIKACYHSVVQSISEYFSQARLSMDDIFSWMKTANPYDPDDAGEVSWARWTLNHLLYWKEANEMGVVGRGELSNRVRITYLNGMLNGHEEVIGYLGNLSEMHGGANIHYVFRESNGFCKDVLKAGLIKAGYESDHARELAKVWKHMIAEMGGVYGGGTIVHYAHSLGAADTYTASALMTEDERKMISVYTFGSPQIIPSGVFRDATNYISRWDGVCLLGPYNYVKALLLNESHVVFLKSNEGLFFLGDHLITCNTYNNVMLGLSSGILALFGPLVN